MCFLFFPASCRQRRRARVAVFVSADVREERRHPSDGGAVTRARAGFRPRSLMDAHVLGIHPGIHTCTRAQTRMWKRAGWSGSPDICERWSFRAASRCCSACFCQPVTAGNSQSRIRPSAMSHWTITHLNPGVPAQRRSRSSPHAVEENHCLLQRELAEYAAVPVTVSNRCVITVWALS